MVTSCSRDIFSEVFDNPHNCVLSKPSCSINIPKVYTLQELLDYVDRIVKQENSDHGEMSEQYSWRYREISQKDLTGNSVSTAA